MSSIFTVQVLLPVFLKLLYTNIYIDTGADKMVQLVMEEMWRVEGVPLSPPCSWWGGPGWHPWPPPSPWSGSLTGLPCKTGSRSILGPASPTESLEISRAITGAEAVFCLDFLKPSSLSSLSPDLPGITLILHLHSILRSVFFSTSSSTVSLSPFTVFLSTFTHCLYCHTRRKILKKDSSTSLYWKVFKRSNWW